jgi:hypothetical protein
MGHQESRVKTDAPGSGCNWQKAKNHSQNSRPVISGLALFFFKMFVVVKV